MGLKTASLVAHDGMSGPREHVLTTSSKTRPALFSRLFTFDSKGEHLLTCAPTSGIIYKVYMPYYIVFTDLIIH